MSKLFETLLRDKSKSNIIYIVLAAGILLILLGNLIPRQPERAEPAEAGVKEYAGTLAAQIEDILSKIEGVGRAKVLLVMENEGEASYVRETGEGKVVILSRAGGGEEALCEEQKTPRVRGAVVVAQGGGSPGTRADIILALCAILNADASKITVFKGE